MATYPDAVPPRPVPMTPGVAEWRAMSAAARERLILDVLDALSDPRITMSEGRPHKRAKTRALDLLGLHFRAIGRVIYLAEEMAVLYPGEAGFTPDVLAVTDVPQPDDDERMAWVVADEGRGLDFVLEVLHRGDRKKDLVDNVERYGRLGIGEYFVYDRLEQRIRGYRLAGPGATRYQPIVPQGGRHRSVVLGLELAVEGGTLRLFHGMAELFGSDDLIRRLTGMVQDIEAKAEQAEAKAEQAEAKAEQAEATVGQAEVKVARALDGLRAGVLAALETRGVRVAEERRARVMACAEPATLERWLLLVLRGAAEEVLE